MDIVITGRRTEVPDRFRRLAEERLAKIEQLAPKAHRADVELSHEPNPRQSQTCEKVEITVRGKGPVIRAEASAEDCAAALDIAFGRLLERLRRSRDRRKVHHGRHSPATLRGAAPVGATDGVAGTAAVAVALRELEVPADGVAAGSANGLAGRRDGTVDGSPDGALDGAEGALDGSPVVIRTKEHAARPMSLDQALYEMELVGHDFFLFVDAESRCPSVVYRRRGWNYGVIRLRVDETVLEVPPPGA